MEQTTVMQITEKCAKVLEFLRANDNGTVGYLGAEIAAAVELNDKGIHGVMNSLVKNDLVAKGQKEAEFVSKDGKKGVKPYASYFLTDKGRSAEYTIKA